MQSERAFSVAAIRDFTALINNDKTNEYEGVREQDESYGTCVVTVNGTRLDMSEIGKMKSPSGYEWGYSGSGPSALAHSILTHEFGDELIANTVFHDFKEAFIVGQSREVFGAVWTITSANIRSWLTYHTNRSIRAKLVETLVARERQHELDAEIAAAEAAEAVEATEE